VCVNVCVLCVKYVSVYVCACMCVSVYVCTYVCWQLEVEPDVILLPASYKYVVVNVTTGAIVGREEGAMRTLYPSERSVQQQDGSVRDSACMVSVRDEATTDRWPEETRFSFRCAGVSIPVSALRSVHGMGVGEFPDLKRLADVCHDSGLRIMQVLPVTDTCAHPHAPWLDTSPYSAISAHALHPMYLRLSSLPDLPHDLVREVEVACHELNAPQHMATSTRSSASPPPAHIGGSGRDAGGAERGACAGGNEPLAADEDVLTRKHRLLRRVYQTSGKRVLASVQFGRHSKEPYIHSKEPYIHSQEPCIQWKELDIY